MDTLYDILGRAWTDLGSSAPKKAAANLAVRAVKAAAVHEGARGITRFVKNPLKTLHDARSYVNDFVYHPVFHGARRVPRPPWINTGQKFSRNIENQKKNIRKKMRFTKRRSFKRRPMRRFGGKRRFRSYSKKSNFNGDSYSRNKRFKRSRGFRRFKKGGGGFMFKLAKMLTDKYTVRTLNGDSYDFQVGKTACYTMRVYRHTYTAATPLMDFNGFLASYRLKDDGAVSGTKEESVAGLFNQYKPANNPDTRFMMEKATCTTTIRNNTTLPIYLNVYIWKAKRDIPSNNATIADSSGGGPGFNATSAFVPNYLASKFIDSGTYQNSNIAFVNAIADSITYISDGKAHVNQYWKKLAQERVRLNPGEVYQRTAVNPRRVIKLSVLNKLHAEYTTGCYAFKGEVITEILMHGELVHDGTAKTLVDFGRVDAADLVNGLDVMFKHQISGNILPLYAKNYLLVTPNPNSATFGATQHQAIPAVTGP